MTDTYDQLKHLQDVLRDLGGFAISKLNEAMNEAEVDSVHDLRNLVGRLVQDAVDNGKYNRLQVQLADLYKDVKVTDTQPREIYLTLLKVLTRYEEMKAPAPDALIDSCTLRWHLEPTPEDTRPGRSQRQLRHIDVIFSFEKGEVVGKYRVYGVTAKRPFSDKWVFDASHTHRFGKWVSQLLMVAAKQRVRLDEDEDDDETADD